MHIELMYSTLSQDYFLHVLYFLQDPEARSKN